MRRISRAVRVSGFLLASAVCAGAAGAGPVFMKLEGVDVPGKTGSGEIEIQSFHWGPRQTTSADGSRSRSEGDPDRPVIAGSVPNTTTSKRQHGAETISKEWGGAAGAREHDKRTTWVERSAPAAKGSVWIRVATPWAACRAGARYPMIELGDGKASYRLSDVVVTGCDAGGASLDYAKVTVRGWDPAKKEE